jgi:hypothetical protein
MTQNLLDDFLHDVELAARDCAARLEHFTATEGKEEAMYMFDTLYAHWHNMHNYCVDSGDLMPYSAVMQYLAFAITGMFIDLVDTPQALSGLGPEPTPPESGPR